VTTPAARAGTRAGRVRRWVPPGAVLSLLGARVSGAAHALAEDDPSLLADPNAWRDAAVRTCLDEAWAAGDLPVVRALAEEYPRLLLAVPGIDDRGEVVLTTAGSGERRARGAFATPAWLARVVAERVVAMATGDGDGVRADAAVTGAQVPRLVDPACGSGALLRAGAAALLARGVPAHRVAGSLYGVDCDPVAVALARGLLAAELTEAGHACTPGDLAARIVVADALVGPVPALPDPELPEPLSAEPRWAWHRCFPEVLDLPGAVPEPVTGWRGGFDVVVANPPWERLSVIARDWPGAPPEDLRGRWAATSRELRTAGRHPLTAAGELNAYLLFVETCWRLLAPGGSACLIVPAGMATDRSASRLVEALVAAGSLARIQFLTPDTPIFAGVSERVPVALVDLRSGPHEREPGGADETGVVERGGRRGTGAEPEIPGVEICVGVHDPAAPAGPGWRLDAATLRLLNPNTPNLPPFRSGEDARIVVAAHRRCPVLVRRDRDTGVVLDSPWQVRLVTPLHMTREARWFAPAPAPGLTPLWEAKYAGLLDHRAGLRPGQDPRYWVPAELAERRYGELCRRGWLAGYRNVTVSSAPRTLLPCVLPVLGVGNSLPLLSAPRLPLLLAALASLPVDHAARQKHAGANLNFFKLEQLPLPPPEAYDRPAAWAPDRSVGAWVLDRLAEAVVWAPGLEPFADELAELGVEAVPRGPIPDLPVHLAAPRRARALAELDAAHAVLLGYGPADLAQVLDGFPELRRREEERYGRFVTADQVLTAFASLTGE